MHKSTYLAPLAFALSLAGCGEGAEAEGACSIERGDSSD